MATILEAKVDCRTIQANVFALVRVLARALRIYVQERNIHRFWIRTNHYAVLEKFAIDRMPVLST
jgi:hypothetical protein